MHLLRANIIYGAKTSDLATATDLLQALEKSALAPNYHGFSLSSKQPWAVDEILAKLAPRLEVRSDTVVRAFRTKVPKVTATCHLGNAEANELLFRFTDAPPKPTHPAVWESIRNLAAVRPLILAYVGPAWLSAKGVEGMTPEEVAEVNAGNNLLLADMHEHGLDGLAATTWFGPFFVDRIGADRLAQAGAVVDDLVGAVRLDLVPDPWDAAPRTLLDAKRRAMEMLAPSGMFAAVDFRTNPRHRPTPGPRWSPPSWSGKPSRGKKP